MLILADTCSVLMLLRLAPNMFVDPKFNCVTTTEVLRELKSKQVFKTKYPWLEELLPKVKCLKNSDINTDEYSSTLAVIDIILKTYPINPDTDRVYDLSSVDQHIIACAVVKKQTITTGENDIISFAREQFEVNSLSALAVLNGWLENGLVECNEYVLTIIDDWEKSNEAKQPIEEVGRFQQITRKFYKGPA